MPELEIEEVEDTFTFLIVNLKQTSLMIVVSDLLVFTFLIVNLKLNPLF